MRRSNIKKPAYLLAIALIGTAAITAQILLMREIITVFAGNELTYGLVFFFWMALYACGSGLLGRLCHKLNDRLTVFIALQGVIAVLLPAQIFLARVIRNLLGIGFGALVDLPATILIIILLLAPLTLILGFQFALGSVLLSETFRKGSSQISRVYILEAVGSILGGVLFTYVLVLFLNAFQIAALLALLISSSIALIGLTLPRRNTLLIGIGLLIASTAVLAGSSALNDLTAQASLMGQKLVRTGDSPYGRITISEYDGAYNFYENGTLLFSTADELGNEETAHLSLLMHPAPQRILLIGGGTSGITNELLKYRPGRLDVVELDHRILALARQFTQLPRKANFIAADGVKYVRETDQQYDMIIINLPDPTTALLNRFYTLEFFRDCQKKLALNGILTVGIDTSGAYMGRELKLLNQSVNRTLSQAFLNVAVIAGNRNYYFASESRLVNDRKTLMDRWRSRNIRTRYFNANSLNHILWPDKTRYVRGAVAFDDSTPLNTELSPASYFFGLLIWASQFHGPAKDLFYALMRIKFVNLLVCLMATALALKLISLKARRMVMPSVITLLGFTGMCAQLVIIYAFQSLHGYVYQVIGLLTTAYMAGLALGSFLIYRRYERIREPALMLRNLIWLLLFNLAMVLMLLKVLPLQLTPLLVSLPIGAAFPLAVKLHERHKKEVGSLGGILYGADLLGGALAAIATTLLFIPLFGILNTILLTILLAMAALFLAYS